MWGELAKAGISERTQAAIKAGMEIEPSQRPQTMTAFRELLGSVKRNVSIEAEIKSNSDCDKNWTYLYKESSIVLVSDYPNVARAHWEIPVRLKREIEQQGGENMTLYLHDVTHLDLQLESVSIFKNFEKFECDELTRDLHITNLESNHRYLAEIGYFTQNRQWLMLARSSPIWIYSSEHNEDYQIERDSDGNNCDEETINSCNRSLDRDDPDTLCNRGLELYNLGNYEDAIANYDRGLEFEKSDPDIWCSRGMALLDLERYKEAISSYNSALRIKRDNPFAWYCRGIALNNLDRYKEAIASFDHALAIETHEAIWYLRGNALSELEKYEEAVISYDRALELKSDDPDTIVRTDL